MVYIDDLCVVIRCNFKFKRGNMANRVKGVTKKIVEAAALRLSELFGLLDSEPPKTEEDGPRHESSMIGIILSQTRKLVSLTLGYFARKRGEIKKPDPE
jgi:hypothetical protein